MSTDFFPSYVPTQPSEFFTPVTDEDAAEGGGLAGLETPDGHGFLVWCRQDLGQVNYTTLASPMDWLNNDFVHSWSNLLTTDDLYGANCIMSNGQLLVTVTYNDADTFFWEVYVADDPNTPTSFTLLSTVFTDHAGGPFFGIIGNTAPSLLILDNGRILTGTKVSGGPVDNSFQAVAVEIWSSDDFAATWDLRMHFDHPNLFPRAEYSSSTMALDPATDFLWWRSGTGISATDMNNLWKSEDGGNSWTHNLSDAFEPRYWPAVHNNTNIYSFIQNGDIRVYDGSGFAFTDWNNVGTSWAAPGVVLDPIFKSTLKVVITSQGMFTFVRDQVMFISGSPAPGFTIPLLHIPFKDRLMNVQEKEAGESDGR